MILVLKQSHHGSTEFTPAMAESTGVLPGLSPVAGKPVHAAFDGDRLTSDAGVLLLAAIDRRLGICERLARCIEDPRAPERIQHTLAEMIRHGAQRDLAAVLRRSQRVTPACRVGPSRRDRTSEPISGSAGPSIVRYPTPSQRRIRRPRTSPGFYHSGPAYQ
ncbi:hypothetical protein D3868_07785 [Azospirillum brasilense]|uniref:Transposase DDE domain-containing protein n=1 Tax=Azospirillum brasilense TaxID=192 RepID=A0A4D8QI39_AZOBR|nr:hypothetical protein D3868_07785 [Azospirillum brasilense]